jgi:hypothetical protein
MAIDNITQRRTSPRGVHITSDEPRFVLRFWSKVLLTSNPDKCWEWQASTYSNGYGRIWVDEAVRIAHRVAWKITYGVYPTLDLLHSCDNKQCVNPNHLREGTNVENAADAAERGLMQKGIDRWNAKVNPQLVKNIRQWNADGISHVRIAQQLGLGVNTVGSICRRQTWKHVV